MDSRGSERYYSLDAAYRAFLAACAIVKLEQEVTPEGRADTTAKLMAMVAGETWH
jgi:hypothetical protein